MGEQKWYHVDRKLIPLKLLYFIIFSAAGCLLPFLPLYMQQIGFTKSEVGVMYCLARLTNFFAQPITGMIADKFQKHRLVLIISVVIGGLVSSLMLAIPTMPTFSVSDVNSSRICDSELHIRQCEVAERTTMPAFCFDGTAVFFDKLPQNTNTSRNIFTCAMLHQTQTVNNFTVCFMKHSNVKTEVPCKCFDSKNETIPSKEFRRKAAVTREVPEARDKTESSCTCAYSTTILEKVVYIQHLYCENTTVLNCKLLCQWSLLNSNNATLKPHTSFWIFSVLFLLFSVMYLNIEALSNSIAYSTLSSNRNAWGKQRLCGTIGYAVVALTLAYIMDTTRSTQERTDYSPVFYAFGGFCVFLVVICISLDVSKDLKCTQLLTNVRHLLTNPEMLVFLFVVFCFGVMGSVIETFKTIFVLELGAKQLVIGLSVFVSCCLEVPLLFLSGQFIKRFSHLFCLLGVCFAYSLRFVSYSVVTNVWYSLPIELLHGITYGIMYAASSSYINLIAPKELAATAQGLFVGTHSALGSGIGHVVTGVIYDSVGARWMFRAYSIFAIIILVFYVAFYNLYLKGRRGGHLKTQSSKPEKNEVEVTAELMEKQGPT